MKNKAIEAVHKFCEIALSKAIIPGTLSEPVDNEWDSECFTTEATIGWLSVECDHSSTGWLKQQPGVVVDDRDGPYEASEPHFIVKLNVSEEASVTQAQVAFLNSLPVDRVLVSLSTTDYEVLSTTADAIEELLD